MSLEPYYRTGLPNSRHEFMSPDHSHRKFRPRDVDPAATEQQFAAVPVRSVVTLDREEPS